MALLASCSFLHSFTKRTQLSLAASCAPGCAKARSPTPSPPSLSPTHTYTLLTRGFLSWYWSSFCWSRGAAAGFLPPGPAGMDLTPCCLQSGQRQTKTHLAQHGASSSSSSSTSSSTLAPISHPAASTRQTWAGASGLHVILAASRSRPLDGHMHSHPLPPPYVYTHTRHRARETQAIRQPAQPAAWGRGVSLSDSSIA